MCEIEDATSRERKSLVHIFVHSPHRLSSSICYMLGVQRWRLEANGKTDVQTITIGCNYCNHRGLFKM